VTGRKALPFDPIDEARKRWESSGWDDAAIGMAVVTSVVRVQQVFVSMIDQELRPLELSMARYEVLMLLMFSKSGELPLGKIGARLQVQPGAVTNAIDRLVADGCVKRVPHPTDRRTTLAVITAKGRTKAEKAVQLLNAHVYVKLGLAQDKLEELFELMRVVRCQAGDFPEDLVG
jgi:DNA-binding MarR family transcriptional regulator